MIDRDAIPISSRLVARLEALGVSLARVRVRAGVPAVDASTARAVVVTTEAFFAFWRAVEEESGHPDLGLLLGAGAIDGAYSVASAAALRAPDLAASLRTMARYKRLVCPEQVDVEVEGGEARVRFHWVLATTEVPRLLVDSTFASFVALAQRGSGGKAAPLRIELARRSADADLLRTHYACPVVLGAPLDRLGHFQLTARLWPALVRANGARVVSLSSRGHARAAVDFDDPHFERRLYDKWIAYGQSKTANVLFAVALDARGQGRRVRAFAVHPGAVLTELSRSVPEEEIRALRANLAPGTVKTTEEGAATSVWCAMSPALDGMGSVYCEDCDIAVAVPADFPEPRGVRPWATDPTFAERLWTLSEAWTGVRFEG